MMRFFAALTTLVSSAAFSVAVMNAQAQKPIQIQEIDYLAPPADLTTFLRTVSAVVRVNVMRSVPHAAISDDPRVLVDHTVTVLEVLKDASDLAVGSSVTIIQPGGEKNEGTHIVRVDDRSFPRLQLSGEYIVFLNSNTKLGAFEIAYGPHGTYALQNNVVDSPSHSPVAEMYRGQSGQVFAAAIRAAASRNQVRH